MVQHIRPPIINKLLQIIPIFKPLFLIILTSLLFITYWLCSYGIFMIMCKISNYDVKPWIAISASTVISITMRYISNKLSTED